MLESVYETAKENYYIDRIDRKRSRTEWEGSGKPGERVVASFADTLPGVETRPATAEEDMGPEEGGRLTIDLVHYIEGKPAFASQVATSDNKPDMKVKLEQIQRNPIIRLDEMKKDDLSIMKALVFLNPVMANKLGQEKEIDFGKHPEAAIQILTGYINSGKFALSKTQNPLEQKAISDLISMFEQEKKKYMH